MKGDDAQFRVPSLLVVLFVRRCLARTSSTPATIGSPCFRLVWFGFVAWFPPGRCLSFSVVDRIVSQGYCRDDHVDVVSFFFVRSHLDLRSTTTNACVRVSCVVVVSHVDVSKRKRWIGVLVVWHRFVLGWFETLHVGGGVSSPMDPNETHLHRRQTDPSHPTHGTRRRSTNDTRRQFRGQGRTWTSCSIQTRPFRSYATFLSPFIQWTQRTMGRRTNKCAMHVSSYHHGKQRPARFVSTDPREERDDASTHAHVYFFSLENIPFFQPEEQTSQKHALHDR